MKRPARTIFVVVSDDGYLCDFADSREIAEEMVNECDGIHKEPHRVCVYGLKPKGERTP